MFYRIKAAFCKFALALFGSLMNQENKRTFLLTSLYCEMTREKLVDPRPLPDISKTFRFTMPENALQLAAATSERLWKSVDLRSIIRHRRQCNDTVCVNYDDAYDISEDIVDNVPHWLQYDRREMIKDLLPVFYACPVTA